MKYLFPFGVKKTDFFFSGNWESFRTLSRLTFFWGGGVEVVTNKCEFVKSLYCRLKAYISAWVVLVAAEPLLEQRRKQVSSKFQTCRDACVMDAF